MMGTLVFLAGAGYAGFVMLGGSSHRPTPAPARDDARDVGALPALAIGPGAHDAGAPVRSPLPRRTDAGSDAREWERLQSLDLRGDLLLASLDEFVSKYPTSPFAPEAKKRSESLRRVAAGGPSAEPGKASPALEAELLSLLRAGSFGDAAYLVNVAPRLGAADESASARLKKQVEKAAYDEFVRTRDRGRALAAEGRALEGYDLVSQLGLPLRRLAFWGEVDQELAALRRALAMALERGPRGPTPTTGGADREAVFRLVTEAKRAAAACDFDGALDRYRQILALSQSDEERLEFQWKIFDARRTRDLFRLLVERLVSPGERAAPIQITVTQSLKGEVFGGDAGGVKVRLIVPGDKTPQIMEKRWRDVPPIQMLEMFRGLDLDGDGLLALAAYSFEVDYEIEAQQALVAIWQKWPAYKAEGAALYRRHTGLNVGPADLLEFEGRLVTIAERDETLKKRIEAKAEAKRISEELALAKKENSAKPYYDYACALLERGDFIEGRDVLFAIGLKYKDTEVGKMAKVRWEDPLLRRLTMKKTGRDENRVSINFLAEGYPLERNEDQRAFEFTANRAQKILEKTEPWSEYAGYFNYYSINLMSKDRGISREPGGIKKDTPCGGKIDGGLFTINNAQARAWLERFPGPGQAVCIGNDSASVATGGGGAVAVVKGMIDVCAHELGHSFGGLLDEYDFNPGGKPGPKPSPVPLESKVVGINVISGNQRDDLRAKAPWQHWIALSGALNWTGKIVDIFEGANEMPKDMWRPQVDCKMRTASSPFCCVCMEDMVLRIYGSIRPIDECIPKEEKQEIATKDHLDLEAVCLRPKSRPLDAKWEIVDVKEEEVNPDGSTTAREGAVKPKPLLGAKEADTPDGRHIYGVRLEKLHSGLFDVTLTVSDPTVWVAQSDRSSLSDKHTWRVRVR